MATRELLSLSEPPVTPKKESPVNIENMTAGHSQIQSDREKTSGNNDTVLYTQGDHLSKLSSKLKAFREEGVMCDVNINLGVSSVLAHRCVLAAASPKLNSILADSHQALPLTQIDMPTKCPRSFRYVIDYLYTGCLSINVANIPDLIKLGDVLEIQEISLLCVRHLEESLNIESWSSIFNLAVKLNINFILDLTKKFAVDYFSFLSSNNEFRELNYEHLTYLVLHCNAENDQDLEMFKIKEILQWVNHDIERVTYFESLIKYVNLHIIKPISLLETALSALILEAHVRDSAVYRAFCTELEVQKQQGSTDIAVNINDSEMGHKHLQCDLIQNVQMTDSPNLEQESDNETDCGEADDYMVKHNMDKGISTTSSKPKRIRSNIQLQNTEYDVEIAVAQTNKRKSFKPKRSVGVYKAKPTRANSSTRRSRGRPSKLTTSKHEKKPRMKTSCTQVISENIEEEFEEIAREEKDKGDQLVEYNQEDFPTKLETVDEIKLELEESKRDGRNLRHRVSSIDKESRVTRSRRKTKAKQISLGESINVEGNTSDSNFENTVRQSAEVTLTRRRGRKTRNNFKLDVVKDSDTNKFICGEPNCIFSSRFRGSLLRHRQTMHDKTHVRCKLCGAIVTPDGLDQHHQQCHSVTLECDLCGKFVKSMADLRNHKLQNHTDPKDFKYECSHCWKRFHHKANYEGHMDSHNDVKRWLCQQCHKGFSFRSSLLRHVKICKGQKPKKKTYPCEDCGLVFKLKDYLNQHMVGKHSGALNYPCVCGRTFAWRGSLVNHKKSCRVVKASNTQAADQTPTEESITTENSIPPKITEPTKQISVLKTVNPKQETTYKHVERTREPNVANVKSTREPALKIVKVERQATPAPIQPLVVMQNMETMLSKGPILELPLPIQNSERSWTTVTTPETFNTDMKVDKQTEEFIPLTSDRINYLTVSDPTAITQDMGIDVSCPSQSYQVVQPSSAQVVQTVQPSIDSVQIASHPTSDHPDALAIHQTAVMNTQMLQPTLLPTTSQLINTNCGQIEFTSQLPCLVQPPNVEITQSSIYNAQSLGMQLPLDAVNSLLFHQLQGRVIVPIPNFEQLAASSSPQVTSQPVYTHSQYAFQDNQPQ